MKTENSKIENYTLTVGLEIHAELNTRTKMFCDSANDADETHPNVNICPVCVGYPGTLPVINKEAVRSVLRLGVAVGGELADYSEFDRKNYFYPDIPKGYQISQYKHPLVKGGELAGAKLTRIHLEEDTAKSLHGKDSNDQTPQLSDEPTAGEAMTNDQYSLLDFNRAGVPLVELVTEPVIHTPEEAARFAKEFQLLLTYLGIAHANMEKGEMRLEANISVSKNDKMGTKVEVKNLNSFRSVERAISFEYLRQSTLLNRGEVVAQETRGWDEAKGETVSQRLKEESHDYRYFPDPDLPKLFIKEIPEWNVATLREGLPELPWDKRHCLLKLGISKEHAEIYVTQPEWGNFFEEVAGCLGDVHGGIILASNYITSELKTKVEAAELAEVVKMISAGELSSRGAKDVIKIIATEGGRTRDIAESRNLIQKNDEREMKTIAEKIINENEKAVTEYKSGKISSLQFLIGQAMKEMKGSGNPQALKNIFEELLK